MQLKSILLAAAALAAAASPALATVVITQPVASTTGNGGQRLDIEWNENGQTPKISSDWGSINIFLATGSQNVQFKLAQLASNVPASRSDYHPVIPADAGPNSKQYFLRFEGTKLGSGGIPPMAFSAHFTLAGMKGTFNSTIMSVNQGAPTGGVFSTGGAAAQTGMSTTVVASSSSAAQTFAAPTASASRAAGAAAPALAAPAHAAAAAALGAGAVALAALL